MCTQVSFPVVLSIIILFVYIPMYGILIIFLLVNVIVLSVINNIKTLYWYKLPSILVVLFYI